MYEKIMLKNTAKLVFLLYISIIFFVQVCVNNTFASNNINKWSNSKGSLYQQIVPVDENNKDYTHKAMQYALEKTFIKVSGVTDICSNAVIKESIKNPQKFIINHSMFKAEDTNKQMMLVGFNQDAIAERLKKSGIKLIWDEIAPPILVAISFSDESGHNVLQADNYFAKQINEYMNSRGIKLIYPIMDMQDLAVINTSDLRGLFLDQLDSVISRYGNTPTIMGYIEKLGEESYQGRLRFFIEKQYHDIRLKGTNSFDKIADKIADFITSLMLPVFSKDLSLQTTDFNIQIKAVDSIEDLRNICSFFKKSKLILDVCPAGVINNEVTLRVKTRFSVEMTKFLYEDSYLFEENFKIIPQENKQDNVFIYLEWIGNSTKATEK